MIELQSLFVYSALSEISPNVRVFDFNRGKKQLHAKVLVVDRKKAIVGSANFSWGGMYSNYEVGLLIEGEPAWKLAEIIDCLSLMTE
jgi:phosphatidylserine/phosphatidylglycerophosphate/cardiolipin synthase-like enzyme